jgi:tetratricopeptide (TPR) repeat protein
MTRFRSALPVALVALLAGAAALYAVGQARVHGTIQDENGRPVPDVKIKISLPGSSFLVEAASNARGVYAVTLNDATQTYTYTLEKEGFQTKAFPLKVPINSNERHDFEVLSLAEARRRGPTGNELAASERAVAIYNEGAEASQMGDTATARAKFQEAIGLDATLAAAHTALATLDLNEKNWAGAAAQAEKALAIDGADVKALRVLADAYAQLGDAEKAKAASDRLVALDPKAGAGDHYKEGIGKYNAGDTDAARQAFERALALDGEHARSHYMLGLCLAGSDPAGAKEHFETFLRLTPGDPDAATAQEMLKYLK